MSGDSGSSWELVGARGSSWELVRELKGAHGSSWELKGDVHLPKLGDEGRLILLERLLEGSDGDLARFVAVDDEVPATCEGEGGGDGEDEVPATWSLSGRPHFFIFSMQSSRVRSSRSCANISSSRSHLRTGSDARHGARSAAMGLWKGQLWKGQLWKRRLWKGRLWKGRLWKGRLWKGQLWKRERAVEAHLSADWTVGFSALALPRCTCGHFSPAQWTKRKLLRRNCNQRQSEAIRGHQPSGRRGRCCGGTAIRGHQRQSEPISPVDEEEAVAAELQSEAIRGHQRPSEAVRGHQRPSEVIGRHQTQLELSDVIRSNRRQPEATSSISHAIARNQRRCSPDHITRNHTQSHAVRGDARLPRAEAHPDEGEGDVGLG